MIQCIATLYLAIAAATYINMLSISFLYRAIRSGVNSKDRVKIDKKTQVINDIRKFSIIWPYVIYHLIK